MGASADASRIAHHDIDNIHIQVEFLGHHLGYGGIHALPHVHLAEKGRDDTIGVKGQPGIELGRTNRSPRDDVAEKKISSPLGKKEEHKINEEDVFFLLVVAIPLPKLAVIVCLEEEDDEDEENERRSASETAPPPPLLLTADDCRNNISLLVLKME